MIVRRAHVGDASAIARVYVETWRSTYSGLVPDTALLRMSERRLHSMWARQLTGRTHGEAVVVASDRRGTVVGFGSSGPARQECLPFRGEIFTLYVLQDYQGLGLGKRIIAALFEDLVENDMSSAMVWVLADNPSRFFYEAIGGKRVAERTERLWGKVLRESGYGWPDVRHVLAPGRS